MEAEGFQGGWRVRVLLDDGSDLKFPWGRSEAVGGPTFRVQALVEARLRRVQGTTFRVWIQEGLCRV